MATTTFEPEPVPVSFSSGRWGRYLYTGFVFLSNGYIVGLVIYILLRLVVGDSWWWLALLNNFAPYYFLPLLVLLPIALVLRRQDIMVRLLLLLLVGGLWFGPYFLPKTTAAPTGPTLKIASFNIYHHNLRLTEAIDWLQTMDADVIVLQDSGRETFDALSQAYPYTAEPIGSQWMFSRYPIEAQEGLHITSDYWLATRFVLDVNGQPLALYNIQLSDPVGDEKRMELPGVFSRLEFAIQYDTTERDREIALILSLVDDETLPFIVAGDFNMTDHSTIYQQLAARMTDSWREVGFGLGASWPAGASEELPDILPPLFRLDYIWHSDDFRTVEVIQGPRLGSDHLPLVGTLEWLTP